MIGSKIKSFLIAERLFKDKDLVSVGVKKLVNLTK